MTILDTDRGMDKTDLAEAQVALQTEISKNRHKNRNEKGPTHQIFVQLKIPAADNSNDHTVREFINGA